MRDAITHLRLRFSVVLMPLYLWGVWLAMAGGAPPWAEPAPWAGPGAGPWPRILLGGLIIHILLYGGMNAYNSYYDRDDGPIGALAAPPPVNPTVLRLAIACKAAALAAGFALDPAFGLLILLAVILSVLYSHPGWRWKERPLPAALTILIGQGALGVLWGWTAATPGAWPPGGPTTALSTPTGLTSLVAGVAGGALLTLGFYPLTGVYQISADTRRSIRTLAVHLGPAGCFRFAATLTLAGGPLIGLTLALRHEWVGLASGALFGALGLLRARRWGTIFHTTTDLDNHRQLMELAYTNGLLFSALFTSLLLEPRR